MHTLKSWLLDLLFPRLCLGCDILLSDDGESRVCQTCVGGIKTRNDFACTFCNSPSAAGVTCPFCKTGRFLDRIFVAASYDNPLVEKMVKMMKYRFVGSLAETMAGFMAKYLERRFLSGFSVDHDSTLIVPVPLHRRRLNWRGFNQAEIIGRGIGAHLGLDFQDILARKRNHAPQAQTSDRQARIANAAGIFKCVKPELARDKIIFLIDDVATTGSTLDDCARALKETGAREIIGFVFAKGTPASDKKLLQ